MSNITDALFQFDVATENLKSAKRLSMKTFMDRSCKIVGKLSKERLPYSKKSFTNPETGEVWHARGRPPKWVEAQIKAELEHV